MTSQKQILIVTTNTSKISENNQTGTWLEEFAVPYLVFRDTGYEMVVASPLGGETPIAEDSLSCSNPEDWDIAAKHLKDTVRLENVDYTDFDAIFIPGGHGPMFDLPENALLGEIVSYFYNKGKIVSAVCHGPCGLIEARREDGQSILHGKRVTSFTNKEEDIMKQSEFMPFLLQNKLLELGAIFIEEKPWSEHVEIDGNLITGQNPNSSLLVAEAVVNNL